MKMAFILLILLFSLSEMKEYSQKISMKMVSLSQAIYDISKADQKKNLYYEVTRLVIEDDILAMVGYDTSINSIAVVFRGSNNLKNWLADFDFDKIDYTQNPVKCNYCQVHHGFYKAYKKIKGKTQKALRNLLQVKPSYGVIFTGHSLGGAIGNLAAISFKQLNPSKRVDLYTFGQPQVGNDNYAKYVHKELFSYFRIVNKRDLVPQLPGDLIGYRHLGTEIWYKNGMLRSYRQCEAQSKQCSYNLGEGNYDQTLNDHRMKYYTMLIVKALG